jgi:signal transduction histidine kinase
MHTARFSTLEGVQRLYDFLRRYPTWVDSFWAVVMLGIAGASQVTLGAEWHPLRHGRVLAVVPISLAMSVVFALRRRMPERMLLLATAAGLAQLVCGVQPYPADFAMLVIIYTVAANAHRWASRFGLGAGLAAAPLAQLEWPVDDRVGPLGKVLVPLFQMVPFALAWVLGDSVRTRRAYLAHLEERAARLEREREAQSKVAVAAERARIARELHDVVAHNVSVMVVQADGAAYVMDAAPEQAKSALETISGTGRQALAEMRRLLGVLRTGEPGETGEYVPQPDVRQLDELIDQVRTAGLEVEFTVEGAPRPLPSGVELTAYRIVQEALTNTRKHGGPDAGASVRLTYFDDGLGLLVEDDGRGTRHTGSGPGKNGTGKNGTGKDGAGGDDLVAADGLGHGLIGMRERVGMVGGTLDAGPRPGGGFRISALLPLKPVH